MKLIMAFNAYIDSKAQEGLTLTCAWCDSIVVNLDTEAKRPAVCLACFKSELVADLEQTSCAASDA